MLIIFDHSSPPYHARGISILYVYAVYVAKCHDLGFNLDYYRPDGNVLACGRCLE